jgi:uncharacterized tellurite resistance protein B-like protein
MFNNIDEFLRGRTTLEVEASGNPTQRDMQIGTASLLVQMAHVNQNITKGEIDSMVRCMNRQFKLSDQDSADILEAADFLRRDRNKLDDILAAINERFSDSQKQTVLAILWKVMNADGSVSGREAELAASILSQLGLSSDQVRTAKAMADSDQV